MQPDRPVRDASKIVKIDETKIQTHLDRMVLNAAEQTLNALLGTEADQPCNANYCVAVAGSGIDF